VLHDAQISKLPDYPSPRVIEADLDGRAGRAGAPAALSAAELTQLLRLADPRGGSLVDVPRFVDRCRYLPALAHLLEPGATSVLVGLFCSNLQLDSSSALPAACAGVSPVLLTWWQLTRWRRPWSGRTEMGGRQQYADARDGRS
jgi:hypothetical protein